jgi:DNA-binding cell septation regulator SpoVG
MPRYKSYDHDENEATIYKDVCNPITAEFREELYANILEAYKREISPEHGQTQKQE